MMNETSAKIAKDFRSNIAANPKLRALWKKVNNAKASYLDADALALDIARAFGKALSANLGGDTLTGDAYRDILREVLPAGLEDIHGQVSTYAQTVQKGLNARDGIGLNALKAEFPKDKAAEIVADALQSEAYSEIEGRLNANAMNFAQNAATETMKANAQLSEAVGFEVTVDRTYDDVGVHNRKDACEWCLEKEGHWTYSEALANGVFERHPGCACEIIYTRNGISQRQTNWRNNQWTQL